MSLVFPKGGVVVSSCLFVLLERGIGLDGGVFFFPFQPWRSGVLRNKAAQCTEVFWGLLSTDHRPGLKLDIFKRAMISFPT